MRSGVLAAGLVLLTCSLAGCRNAPVEAPKPSMESKVARGEHLVSIIGCDDCHTAKKMTDRGPVPDASKRLAGHWEDPNLVPPPKLPGLWAVNSTMDLTVWSGPWGISYAFNLTPDEDTGIGIWTEEMFVKAIREGKHMGQSRPILPPMPWQNMSKLSDDDLSAIFAYLRTLPPIKNRVPEPVIAPPPAP
jgi:cytochrome c553